MRLQDYAPNPEDVPDSFSIIWPAFVKTVVLITIEAYYALVTTGKAQKTWEEDTFTVNLTKCLRPIAYRHPQNLRVQPWFHVITPEMEAGEVSPKKAKIIDIQLCGQWHQNARVYFAWECKLIADYSDRKYKDLVNEYIKNGIFRFIDKHYSAYVTDAGMLGYVLAGEVPIIVEQINRSMKSSRRQRTLPASETLNQGTPVGNFEDIYSSSHARALTSPNITLHHMFLKFNFSGTSC